MTVDLLIHDASEVLVGPDEQLLEAASVVVEDGEIVATGPTAEIERRYPRENAAQTIDASGQAVIPGFVDSHTHALFAGDRSDEFAAKLRGKTYQEILAEGGGIHRTVDAVRAASRETLLDNLLAQLDVLLAHGTTTVEVKSGYGLDLETELRMLEVIDEADDRHPVDVIATFLGAHAVPRDSDADEYVARVIDEFLPAVADQGIAAFNDVFCDEGAFTVEQSRRVLEAGAEYGLTPKIHAEELARTGAAQLAADVGAASADHLLMATREDAEALFEAGVTPVFLPGTAFGLDTEYADAGMFRAVADEMGVDSPAIAIASDLNPNCYAQSMGFASTLACVGMKLAPMDALVAATAGGARALNRTDGLGTLREGAPADLAIVDAPTAVHVPYNFGVNAIETVIKGGRVVHE
ncbi:MULTISPECIES: imidazolonepropionase [Halolamina]|uniref:Imidazolonepropionase n=1 Tax=Halolamina pelagica TaxID=699431 RepID=A0A1I5TRE2_9EURY|nr:MULTISPECIES: imidazolonepropionase [Halolamina]NHX37763.1 imidazolonepropionase [Halolamina sp. R1-12]SFP85167.1 imidazolonepropionase [Halolamina pelagica]